MVALQTSFEQSAEKMVKKTTLIDKKNSSKYMIIKSNVSLFLKRNTLPARHFVIVKTGQIGIVMVNKRSLPFAVRHYCFQKQIYIKCFFLNLFRAFMKKTIICGRGKL